MLSCRKIAGQEVGMHSRIFQHHHGPYHASQPLSGSIRKLGTRAWQAGGPLLSPGPDIAKGGPRSTAYMIPALDFWGRVE